MISFLDPILIFLVYAILFCLIILKSYKMLTSFILLFTLNVMAIGCLSYIFFYKKLVFCKLVLHPNFLFVILSVMYINKDIYYGIKKNIYIYIFLKHYMQMVLNKLACAYDKFKPQ